MLLAVRFLSEIALVVGAVWAGWQAHPALGVLAGLAVVAVWAVFIAPKAGRRLGDPTRLVLEVLLFVAVAVELVATGAWAWGPVLAAVGIAAATALRATHTPA